MYDFLLNKITAIARERREREGSKERLEADSRAVMVWRSISQPAMSWFPIGLYSHFWFSHVLIYASAIFGFLSKLCSVIWIGIYLNFRFTRVLILLKIAFRKPHESSTSTVACIMRWYFGPHFNRSIESSQDSIVVSFSFIYHLLFSNLCNEEHLILLKGLISLWSSSY